MKRRTRFSYFLSSRDERNGRKPPKWSINLPWKTRRVIGGSLLDIHIEGEPRERERRLGNIKMLYTHQYIFKVKRRAQLATRRKKTRNKCTREWIVERLESLLDLSAIERKKGQKPEVEWRSGRFTWLYCRPLQASPDLREPATTPASIYRHYTWKERAPVISRATFF